MPKGETRRGLPNGRCRWPRRGVSCWSIAALTGATPLTATCVHAQSIVRRDSAGIRVIEVAANGLDALPTWRLEGPTTRIAPDMGGVEYEFTRASSPWRLADGRIVLANNQVELRFFDARGRYLTTVARRGRGPGEYEQLLRVFRVAGDTLLAWDVPTSRIDVRDPNGKLVRAFNIPRTLTFAGLGGPGAVYELYRRPDLQKQGVRQDTVVLRQLHKDGTAGEIVAQLPGSWLEMSRARGGAAWRAVELSGEVMLAGGVDGAVYVQGDEFTAYWFGEGGKLGTISRVRLPRTRVTTADRRNAERGRNELIARNPQVRVDPGQSPAVFATFLPQVTRLTVDHEGRAWLRRWTGYDSRTAEWIVLERSGAPIARIMMPAALHPNDIGKDYVLGILPDEDGLQSVHEYRIVR
jgi:hypothetical protein